MVSDYAQRFVFAVFTAGQFTSGFQQRLEQVDFVVAVHALHNGRDTLEAHAGVYRGLRQWNHVAVFFALELHEHVVPDLDKPVAVFFRRSRRATPDVFAVIVENFGTGTARAGIAHGPEVIGGVTGAFVVTDTNDLIGRHAHLFVPDVVGFVVFGVHRYHQLFSRQVQPLR